MCDRCPAETDYARAYKNTRSVTVSVNVFCPKCSEKCEVKDQIHFGGEFWEPYLGCKKCGWGHVIGIHISAVNEVRRTQEK